MTADGNDDRLARVNASRADDVRANAPDRSVVSQALNRLQPLHREVITRAYYMGWTTDQIAADLSIADSAVKAALHSALHTVRHMLGDPTLR